MKGDVWNRKNDTFIHSFIGYLLRACSVPGPGVSAMRPTVLRWQGRGGGGAEVGGEEA